MMHIYRKIVCCVSCLLCLQVHFAKASESQKKNHFLWFKMQRFSLFNMCIVHNWHSPTLTQIYSKQHILFLFYFKSRAVCLVFFFLLIFCCWFTFFEYPEWMNLCVLQIWFAIPVLTCKSHAHFSMQWTNLLIASVICDFHFDVKSAITCVDAFTRAINAIGATTKENSSYGYDAIVCSISIIP